jgi:hypothetical protein
MKCKGSYTGKYLKTKIWDYSESKT